jgi:hypothetical protein
VKASSTTPDKEPAGHAPANGLEIDEVLRKIGRILIIYQQVEAMIRTIGRTCQNAGFARDLAKNLAIVKNELST